MNDEIEGTTGTESISGELTHVACRESTDAQRRGQRHHRCVLNVIARTRLFVER